MLAVEAASETGNRVKEDVDEEVDIHESVTIRSLAVPVFAAVGIRVKGSEDTNASASVRAEDVIADEHSFNCWPNICSDARSCCRAGSPPGNRRFAYR